MINTRRENFQLSEYSPELEEDIDEIKNIIEDELDSSKFSSTDIIPITENKFRWEDGDDRKEICKAVSDS